MSTELHKDKIGLATATIVGMNAMIGAGIFGVPAALASNVGPAGLITYAFVIIAVFCMGLRLARVAQLYPGEGSFYNYARQWGGHTVGLIAAGAYFVGLLVAMGLLAQYAGSYLVKFFPMLSAQTLGACALGSLIILNLFGMSLSELGQRILIVCTVFPILATIVLCFSKADFSNLTPFMPYGLSSVWNATRAVIFGFFGFECAASLFNIVHEPEKNVSRALVGAIVIVGLLYILFVSSIILAVPTSSFTDPRALIPDLLAPIFPHQKWILSLIHISILSAVLGTIHSMIWSSSALLVSYLKQFKNKYVLQLFKKNYINHTTAVLTVGFLIFCSFYGLENVNLFFSITAITIVSAYILSMISLLFLPGERHSKQGIITVLGLATAGVILYFALQGLISELYATIQ